MGFAYLKRSALNAIRTILCHLALSADSDACLPLFNHAPMPKRLTNVLSQAHKNNISVKADLKSHLTLCSRKPKTYYLFHKETAFFCGDLVLYVVCDCKPLRKLL